MPTSVTSQPEESMGENSGTTFDVTRVNPDFTRLDATKLARCFAVSTWVIKGLKLAALDSGDSPFVGRYTTLRRASDWFDRHPEFVASHHLRKKSQQRQD